MLDISSNKIKELKGISHLQNLEDLWASSNDLNSFSDVERELSNKPRLRTVYFEGNPLQRDNEVTYRNKIRLALPQITKIDATFIGV